MKKLLIILAAMLAVASCKKDDTLIYGSFETGTFHEGRFYSDRGVVFNIRENVSSRDIADIRRAFIYCDIYTSEDNGKSYDIRLRDFTEMYITDPVMASSLSPDRVAEEDPATLSVCWLTGNYINFQMQFVTVSDSKAEHRFSIIVDDAPHGGDSLLVKIEHFADGEYIGAQGFPEEDYAYGNRYLSLPLGDLVDDEVTSIPFQVSLYTNNKTDDGLVTPEKSLSSYTGTLKR